MSYSSRTSKYNIPVPRTGDIIESTEEKRIAEIIEHQLIGAITAHSGGSGVIAEGTYVATFVSDNSTVTLSTNAQTSYSLESFIDKVYQRTNKTLIWDALTNNDTHYLFAILIEDPDNGLSSRQFGDVKAISNTSGSIPANGILLAVVTITGSSISLNITPTTKKYIYTVAEHMSISNNPHGTLLQQNVILSSGIVVNDLYAQLVEVNQIIASGIQLYNTDLGIAGTLNVTGEGTFSGTLFARAGMFVKELLQAKNAIASGLVVIGESTFHNNVYIMSGSTFDGIDPGSLRFLLDGSNADWDPIDLIQGHRHSSFVEISGTTVGLIPFAPVYHMKTDSGQVLPTQYYDPTTESNLEKVVIDGADQEISQMKIFRIPVPDDFISFSGINIRHAEDIDGLTKVNLQLLDTSGEIIDLYPNQIFKPSATLEYEKVFPVEQIYNVIDPGQFLTFTYDYRVASGTSQSIDYTAEILLYYNRV